MARHGRWAAFLVTLLAASAVQANPLEKLLMPGELSDAHARFEDDCSACHDKADRSRQRAQCLGCHDHADVAADIKQGRGLHGRVARAAECKACHTEHKGRKADIVHLDPGSFDHTRTDFPLTGAHAGASCGTCHRPGRTWREAPGQCVACHRDDDVHRGKLGDDCAQCHQTGAFRPAKFDHARTRFPLTNAHAKVTCVACHRDPGYKGTPLRCADCHAADDVHHGSRGIDCASCHGTADWKQSRFDHVKASKFALQGRHAKIPCNACHLGGDLKAKLPRDCAGCHAAADPHAGRFGTACADCHTQQEWKVASYDHEAKTQYPLRGAHLKLGCHACHTGVIKQRLLPKDCHGCHAADDVHAGSMGQDCQSCHRETGWRDEVRFDHDLATFPLVGLHVDVACEECHTTRAYRDAPVDCVACHRARDVHKGRLGEHCETCHNANGWSFWQFDHGKQTKFALRGAHAGLGCRDCHREADHDMKLPQQCVACHARDDVHDGRFGRDCGRCHDADSFRGAAAH